MQDFENMMWSRCRELTGELIRKRALSLTSYDVTETQRNLRNLSILLDFLIQIELTRAINFNATIRELTEKFDHLFCQVNFFFQVTVTSWKYFISLHKLNIVIYQWY